MFESTLGVSRLQRRTLANGAMFAAITHAAISALMLRASAHPAPKTLSAAEVTLRLAPPPPPPPPLGGAAGIKPVEPKKPVVPKKDTYVQHPQAQPTS